VFCLQIGFHEIPLHRLLSPRCHCLKFVLSCIVTKFPEQFYVGIRDTQCFSKEVKPFLPLLLLHMKVMRRLTSAKAPGIKLIKNQFHASVYSPSHMLLRAADPRGVQLQMSSDNLAFLVSKTIIVHEAIQEPLVWGRVGNQNYFESHRNREINKYSQALAPKDTHPEAALWRAPKKTTTMTRERG
jgi:hypothetical protein